ncbi:unnamed protein product [Closterium sp. NIES-64]|nr:unnamed protein product [Closterium sp. NIES-64]
MGSKSHNLPSLTPRSHAAADVEEGAQQADLRSPLLSVGGSAGPKERHHHHSNSIGGGPSPGGGGSSASEGKLASFFRADSASERKRDDNWAVGASGGGRRSRRFQVAGSALVSGMCYCASSCSMILLNKVHPASGYFHSRTPLPAVSSSTNLLCQSHAHMSPVHAQNLVSVTVVLVLVYMGVIATEPLTLRLMTVWLPVNLIFVGMLVTSFFSLQYMQVAMVTILKNVTNLITAYMQVAMVTILKNVTNLITAVGEMYLFRKRHSSKVWALSSSWSAPPPFPLSRVIIDFRGASSATPSKSGALSSSWSVPPLFPPSSLTSPYCSLMPCSAAPPLSPLTVPSLSAHPGMPHPHCAMQHGSTLCRAPPHPLLTLRRQHSQSPSFFSPCALCYPCRLCASLLPMSPGATWQILSAFCGGFTDLAFHPVGYTWQIFNCFFTAAYSYATATSTSLPTSPLCLAIGTSLPRSMPKRGQIGPHSYQVMDSAKASTKSGQLSEFTMLTLGRVMDSAKAATKSGQLSEFTMVLLNNALSFPLARFPFPIFPLPPSPCQTSSASAKAATKSGQLSEFTMVLLNNALSFPPAILLIIAFSETKYLLHSPLMLNGGFWVAVTLSGLLGLAISFTSMWFLHQTSPTTYSLVGSLNKIPLSLFGIILFNAPTNAANISSILFVRPHPPFFGVLFARAKMLG